MTQTAKLAFGRILRMASRPEQEGDAQEYERCKAIIENELAPDCFAPFPHAANYARDYGKGDTTQWN